MGTKFLRSDLVNFQKNANMDVDNQIKEMMSKGKKIYHFGFGESPFPVPETFRQGLIKSAHRNEYLSVQGLLSLREKIISFHKKYEDFDHFSPHDILLGAGSKELIYHSMNIFGGEILLPSPAWTSYAPQTTLSSKKWINVNADFENKFCPTGQQAILRGSPDLPKMLILNSPNNPTGLTYTEEQIQEIAQVCRKHKVVVISDEIYARLSTVPFTSISQYYPEGTIVTSGFSKWASLGGWRAGYALFPRELGRLREAVASAGSHSFTCQPSPIQHALVYGLDDLDALDEYIVKTRSVMDAVGRFCHRELKEAGVSANQPEGTYYFMPDFAVCRSQTIPDGTALCKRLLKEANVALMPCDPHYNRPPGELTTRFAFVNFDGTEAMKNVPLEGFEDDEEESGFVQKYCTPVAGGVKAIKEWVKKNKTPIKPYY
uniref:Aminotransferase class I/classII domain-containing protein n=1 Tax=Acrobeloides nanus TaxID=290746 RepID=A0A914DL30_9BILA